jgi:hypothetical protein
MKQFKISAFCFLLIFSVPTFAQIEVVEEEDFSEYADYGTDESEKRYCGPKVVGLSPAKLISIGYDFAGPHDITGGAIGNISPESTERASYYQGLRIAANIPVYSTNALLINIGGNYGEANYTFDNSNLTNPLHVALNGGIKTLGINTTIFKPFNAKHFALGFYGAEYSGNYTADYLQSASFIKHSWVGIFGWKFNERFQFGFGATQSYRAGEVNYFPIIMYNYTSVNGKWGIEMLAPARAHFRYRFSSKSLILAGMDLEGTSYHISNRDDIFPAKDENNEILSEGFNYNSNQLELRRSEIRLNIKFERALTDFIWISAQAGYAMNYRSDVDSGEFFRGFFKEDPYVMENNVAGVPYIQFSLNLVSP